MRKDNTMKFQFLGTAAAEGIPAIFCECAVCQEARAKKGKEIRTRSQALIDDVLLIDFNADTYMHFLNNDIIGSKIKTCLVTHTHMDHLQPEELTMRLPGFGNNQSAETLTFYGSDSVGKKMSEALYEGRNAKSYRFEHAAMYKPFEADGYRITAMYAVHDPTSGPYIYLIEKDGKTVLYAHDTGYFHESVWNYLAATKPYIHLASLDCTAANEPVMGYDAHMNLNLNIRVRDRLIKMGCADDKTLFVCNHFSHNGKEVLYDTFRKIAHKHGFLTSYDGMILNI